MRQGIAESQPGSPEERSLDCVGAEYPDLIFGLIPRVLLSKSCIY